MAVPGFCDTKPVMGTSTGIFSRNKPQISGELLGGGESFKIPYFYNRSQGCMGFDSQKTGQFTYLFLIICV